MQTLHYLTLSILIPPLLSIFAEPMSLSYEGGATNVGMVIDWREMAGRPTVRGIYGEGKWSSYPWTGSGGKRVDHGWSQGRIDLTRGWIIAFCWIIACSADIYYMYALIRRPRLILDFALTLVFNHLVLTTYYSASIPTSLFFWMVMIGGCVLTVVVAEQLCVKRELSEGLSVAPIRSDEEDADTMELGLLRRD